VNAVEKTLYDESGQVYTDLSNTKTVRSRNYWIIQFASGIMIECVSVTVKKCDRAIILWPVSFISDELCVVDSTTFSSLSKGSVRQILNHLQFRLQFDSSITDPYFEHAFAFNIIAIGRWK
jgi:hypothetical protein